MLYWAPLVLNINTCAIQLLYWAPLLLNINICAIQLLYWAPQTYRTPRNTIVILGTTNIISHASCSIESLYRTSRAHSHHCIARVVLNTTSESARQQHVPLINNSNNNTINQYLILLPTVRQLVRLCLATYPAMNSHTNICCIH